MKKDEPMSRRGFLEKAGVAAAGLTLAGPVKSLMAQGITGETGESPPSVQSPSGSGVIVTVAKDGSGDYDNIQDAIDAIANGDTVHVQPGLYDERIDFLGKAITVEGKPGPYPDMYEGGVEAISLTANGEASTTDTWLEITQTSAGTDTQATLTIQFRDSVNTSNDEEALSVWFGVTSTGSTAYSLADVVTEINTVSQDLGFSPEGKELNYDAAETYYDSCSGKYVLKLCSRELTSDEYTLVLTGITTVSGSIVGGFDSTGDVTGDMQTPTSAGLFVREITTPCIRGVLNGVHFTSGEGPDSVLKNFYILQSVKAIVVDGSSPTIRNITAIGNNYGVYAASGSPDISNCIFWWNHIDDLYGCQARYSCIEDGDPGEGNISANPLWAASQGGRFDANKRRWVQDGVTSPCIDAGDPNSPIGDEPFPNGGRINMGAFGGSPIASKSYFGSPPCRTHIAGDINGDCMVNFKDLGFVVRDWLKNNSP